MIETEYPFTIQVKFEYQKMFLNWTEYKQIFAKGWKTKIELFEISYNLLQFISQHQILPYFFAKTMFKFHSMGSEIMINDAENAKVFAKFFKINTKWCTIWPISKQILMVKKTNSLPGSNFSYSVIIHINLILIRLNSLGQTEYCYCSTLIFTKPFELKYGHSIIQIKMHSGAWTVNILRV